MANWEDQRQVYKDLGRLAEKTDDDLLGRRIIRGLGHTNGEKIIYKLEHMIIGTEYGSEPLYKRALRIFTTLVGRNTDWCHLVKHSLLAGATPPWEPFTLTIKGPSEAVERFSQAEDYDRRPLMFSRLQDTKDALVFTIWQPDELRLLRPPFNVLACPVLEAKWRLVYQDVVHFVQQFGPYHLGVQR